MPGTYICQAIVTGRDIRHLPAVKHSSNNQISVVSVHSRYAAQYDIGCSLLSHPKPYVAMYGYASKLLWTQNLILAAKHCVRTVCPAAQLQAMITVAGNYSCELPNLQIDYLCVLQIYLAMPASCPVEPDGSKASVPDSADERNAVKLYASEDEGNTFVQVRS